MAILSSEKLFVAASLDYLGELVRAKTAPAAPGVKAKQNFWGKKQ
jgi:hypothetical protein